MNKEEILAKISDIEIEQEQLKYVINNILSQIENPEEEGMEQNNALFEANSRMKILIVQRIELYELIGMQPRWGLPKRLMDLHEEEQDLEEFFETDMTKSAKPWDFLNPNTEYADEDLANKRYSICENCPMLINISKQCKKCGCFMKVKTKLLHATCPIGSW